MIGKPKELIQWLFDQDKNKLFEIKEHKEKRSLNANALFWNLVGKIADAIRSSKDEVYLLMLKRYGQSEKVYISKDVDITGYFNYFEASGEYGNMREYTIFKGSSEYNTEEMSILIDGVISEAKELGIETLPPWEIERMVQRWNP